MEYFNFAQNRQFDLLLLGRVTIDLNPAVEEGFKQLKDVTRFEKYLGGSPANIACGVTKHGLKVGFIGKVSDDQFGDFVVDYFDQRNIDTSHITRCVNGEKLGLTFTEMLSSTESSILMYRNSAADLQLSPNDIDEEYIASSKAILISGTALAASPSREAVLKACMYAKKHNVMIIFDLDYRAYTWKCIDEISVYYSLVAHDANIIMGSREEFDLLERLAAPNMSDEESAEFWFQRNATIVIIKHGKQGSHAFLANGDQYRVKPFPVESRKGFGGGDGYASGFLYGVFQGWEMKQCLELASAEASMMVRSNNCSDDLPTTDQVLEFIASSKQKHEHFVCVD